MYKMHKYAKYVNGFFFHTHRWSYVQAVQIYTLEVKDSCV